MGAHIRRTCRLTLILLFVFGLCASLFGMDADRGISQLYHTGWTAKEGLPGIVLALAQTKDGYLWVGTTDGLFRFDGLTFEAYQPDNGQFSSKAVLRLLAVPDGGLWIGYQRGGASYLKDGQVINYPAGMGFPLGMISSFAMDGTGTMWASVTGGLVHLDHGHWVSDYKKWNYPGRSARRLFRDDRGTLWVSTGERILFLPKGAEKFQDSGVLCKSAASFNESLDGTVWIMDADAHRMLSLPSQTALRSAGVNASGSQFGMFAPDGSYWITDRVDGLGRVSSQEQLSKVKLDENTSSIETFGAKQGLTSDVPTCALLDREGNIWIGTLNGLDRFRHRNLTWSSVLPGPHQFSLVAGDHGDVWAASDPGGVVHIPDGKPTHGGPEIPWGAYRDPSGTFWFYPVHTLWHWESGKFSKAALPAGALSDRLGSVTMDHSGTLWVSVAGSGEYRLQNGAWTFTTVLKDHSDWTATSAYTDSVNRVWLAYPGVLAAVNHGQVETFTAQQGLTIGPIAIIAGDQQNVWIGGEDGVAVLAGATFRKIIGLDDNDFGLVTGIVSTSKFGVWLAASQGIVQIPEDEIQKALRQSGYKVKYRLFDLISDLPEPGNRNGAPVQPAVQSSDGILWFSTTSGVARVDPAQIYTNSIPPPVSIRSVVADGKTYSTFVTNSLPALTKSLRIDYAGLSLSIPERVKFRYRLDGSDTDWVDAGSRRQAFYTNPGRGTYRFHVIACNNDGVWNNEGATIDFTVLPAWYQTYWFFAFCTAIALFFIWSLYRMRLRQVAKAMSVRFDERLEERTRIARDLHDTFLQTIQGSKLVADSALRPSTDPVRMRGAMEQLSVWLGRATDEGRAALNSLRTSTIERNDLAAALRRAIDECRIRTSMEAILSVIGEVSEMHPIVRDEVYRIGYEAILNACNHSQASHLKVELTYAENLTLRVTDNGVGMDPSVTGKGKDGHFGLQGMRERAVRISANLAIASSTVSGTEIKLVVPGSIIYCGIISVPQKFPAKIKSLLNQIGLTSKPTDP